MQSELRLNSTFTTGAPMNEWKRKELSEADREKCYKIASVVAGKARVPLADVLSTSRFMAHVRPRRAAMLLARQRLKLSYPMLGKAFKRDHTTVLDGVRDAESGELSKCPDFQALLHNSSIELAQVHGI